MGKARGRLIRDMVRCELEGVACWLLEEAKCRPRVPLRNPPRRQATAQPFGLTLVGPLIALLPRQYLLIPLLYSSNSVFLPYSPPPLTS